MNFTSFKNYFFNSSQENKEAYSFEISKDLVWVSLKISAEIPIVVMRSYVDLDGEMVWSYCKIFENQLMGYIDESLKQM